MTRRTCEVVVELHEIGDEAGRDPAPVGHADHRQRVAARGGDGGRQRQALADDHLDRDVEAEDGAGERVRAGQGDPAADDGHVQAADPPSAVARAGERDGVADEEQPVGGLGPGDQPPQAGMDVDAVGDELDIGRVVEECREGETRGTMVEAAHRVEQVGRGRAAGRVAGAGLVERGGGVADRHRDAAVAQPGGSCSRAPGSSGAIVMRRRPSRSGSRASGATSAGVRRWAGSWAPRRPGARNGPSRSKPNGSAPSAGATGRQARTRSAKAARSSSGAETAVGRNDVTPRRSSARAMPSRAAASPMASWPPQPWTWTSTNPGAIRGPRGASRVVTAATSSSSTAAIRPSSTVMRPGTTRSSRTSRPTTVDRASLTGRRRALGLDPVPRRRTARPGHSGRRGSAIRSPRSGGRRCRR